MDVDAIRTFLIQAGGLILAPLLFGCPVILFVLILRDKDRALEKKVITETSQKYVARKFSKLTRLFLFLSMFAWIGLFIPIIIWLILEEAYVDHPFYIAAGCSGIGLIVSLIFALTFMRRKEEYALVDSRGLSIVYKDESAKRYVFENFGQILLYRKRYPAMEYINEKGKKELIDSSFLTYADATAMAAAIREMHARSVMANR
ncbi:MAG: hypothetical protein J5636_05255 [Clostridiales bacterium]|nr:hypothetical protein [Clostridiales bacterium]